MDKNTSRKRKRTTRFTVAGEYRNAHNYEGKNDIEDGDVCVVKVGETPADGDIVLINCDCHRSTGQHHHAQYYRVMHGQKYKFRLNTWNFGSGGDWHKEGEEEGLIVGVVVRVIKKGGKKDKQPKQGKRSKHRAGFDWPYFGVHDDDTLIVESGGTIEPGQLIYYRSEKYDGETMFARLCCVKGDKMIVTGDGDSYSEPLTNAIGRVVEIKHEKCVEAKVKPLREKLAELQDDTDHTLNLTKCFEIEKQIYDLEHPIEQKEETEDDSILDAEEIGEGGAR